MIVGFGAIVGGIIVLGGELGDFLNLPSVVLVIVPTIASLVATFPMSLLSKVPAHFKVILGKEYRPQDYIDKIVELAQKARRDGLLSFEREEVDDPTMQFALRMIADGRDRAFVEFALEDSMNGIKERHAESVAIYDKAAAYAPAFGMCATVVSLVNMLMGLDFADPNAINNLGFNMAAALITTLYGSLLANVIFIPISGKLKVLHKKEMFCKAMICNGLLSVQSGANPLFIKDYLTGQLSDRDAKRFEGAGAGGAKTDA